MGKKIRIEKDNEKRVINKTQLNIELAEKRSILHRDYISHAFRWTHIVKCLARLKNRNEACILDIGCADFPLLRTIYTNKFKPKYYLGLDIRDMSGKENITPNFEFEFTQIDILNELPQCKYGEWNVITFLEVLEHNTKESGIKILNNINNIMSENTTLYLSTPCYNGKDHASNHVYEWTFQELTNVLAEIFNIQAQYGTFASQSDIEPVMSDSEKEVYESLKKYYDTNVLSVIFAPNHPANSRNAIHVLRKK